MVDLVAQTALGQGHVQHHLVGAVLLHRRQGSAQAVQLVQIDRKANGTGPGGELLHQQVVPAALEQGAGQGFEVALKNKAVVVFHLTGQGQIQPDGTARLFQRPGQPLQLFHRSPHGVVAAQGFGTEQGVGVAAAEGQHPAQGVGGVLVQPGGEGSGPQLVGVFLAQLAQQARAGVLRHLQSIKQTEQIAHVAHFQHPVGAQLPQRLCRKTHGLLHFRFAHTAQKFQTHLADLLEGVALCRGAVDVFVVVVAQRLAGGGLRRFGNGEGHVRLESQQTAVQVGEGDDLFRRKKAAVGLIQAVLLKPAHVVLAAPCGLVQRPQGKGGTLLGLQRRKIKFHVGSPLFFLHHPAPVLPAGGCGTFRTQWAHPGVFCLYFTLS